MAFLCFGDYRVERAQHVHRRGRRKALLLITLQPGERRGGNVAQNIFAIDCSGDFEAIRAVRQAKAHFHWRARGQVGDNAVFGIAAGAQRRLVRTDSHRRDKK